MRNRQKFNRVIRDTTTNLSGMLLAFVPPLSSVHCIHIACPLMTHIIQYTIYIEGNSNWNFVSLPLVAVAISRPMMSVFRDLLYSEEEESHRVAYSAVSKGILFIDRINSLQILSCWKVKRMMRKFDQQQLAVLSGWCLKRSLHMTSYLICVLVLGI